MKYLFLIITCLAVHTVQAAQEISWESLIPDQPKFQSVSPANKALVTEIYVYEVAMQSRQLSPMELDGYNQRVTLAEKLGLNVRELVAEMAAGEQELNRVISDLYINNIKLVGFLVPLEMTGLEVTQFILVPTAGACIHTPPPPVNQTILVEFPEGYEMSSLYTPVWVTGDLKADKVDASVALIDGNQPVEAGYVIDASQVQIYEVN
ncbi:DUF3299 domain-containing protein [Vibrio alginolyticus]|nr:DUF3299 domain-containing protein [Vibrio alginolyticus]